MELNVLNKTGGKETLLNEFNYVFKWKKKTKKTQIVFSNHIVCGYWSLLL